MGFGQSINFNMPYIVPPLNFGGTSSSTSVQSTETPEEAERKRKKEEAEKAAAEFEQRMVAIKQRAENEAKLREELRELEKSTTAADKIVKKAQNGKVSADGTIKAKENWNDYNKLPWWKKALRAGSHMAQGAWKLATGFVGYETNPKTGESKWNWKKCLTNVAVAGALIGLTCIPYVGPVVSTALLATGVVCGTYSTGKGVIKAINAETPEELDYAYQDIGAGLTIGVSSALGLRGLGKGMQASSAASGAGSATASTSNAVRATGSNAFSQFTKDATINAYRATVQAVKNDKVSIAAKGFRRTWGANIKGVVPKLGKTKFEASKKAVTDGIETRLQQINQELANPSITRTSKILLEQEQKVLIAQKNQINGTMTKLSWEALGRNSKAHRDVEKIENALSKLEANGKVKFNKSSIRMTDENLVAMQQYLDRAQKLSRQIEELTKIRALTIKKMSYLKKYASEVEGYTGKTRSTRLGRIYDTHKLAKGDITLAKTAAAPFKLAWKGMMLPFKPWNYIQSSPASTFYKFQETIAPEYEFGMLTTGTMADLMDMGAKTIKAKITTIDNMGQKVEQEVAVTKDVLAQLEQQKAELDKALADKRNELNNLYNA